jgi:two-component system sensor histidine kinase/response regulator
MALPLSPVKILMVDDEPKNLLALDAVLGGLGHELVKAHSGKEALRCLMRDDFAVILLDVQMPEMDGFETAALIRSRERTRYTPIIFLTAVGKSEADMFHGYEVGAVDYMLKPFAPEILRYKVAVLVELHQKSAEVLALNTQLTELNASLEQRVQERTASLEERGRELSRSNQELAQFAAAASHDLQEPLRTMATYLQLFQAGAHAQLEAREREYLDIVLESAQRMRQLINDLMAFSQAGSEDHGLQEVDCGALVERTLGQLKALIDTSGASIKVGPLPTVRGEPQLLGQVFQNLISNALKFVKGATPVLELGCEAKASEWVFWVRDEGIGISPEYFDMIFKLFRRLHTRDEYPGSGLGLSLCKKIVERHGGRIWVESALGKGSTFYFSLPKAARSALKGKSLP